MFGPLVSFLERVPAIQRPVATGTFDNGCWWAKFSIDLAHPLAWHVVQELGYVLSYLSLEDQLPTVFKPVSPPPYLNGGPDESLSWVIECEDLEFRPSEAAEWLEGRLPRPVTDASQWHHEWRNPLGGAMTTREQLEEMFAGIRANARWSIDGECCWDYFFTDSNRDRLIDAAELLERDACEVVGLLEPNPDDDAQETVFLQVRRVECHTVDSLHALNAKLYAFATAHGLASYDGMDVSPVERVI